MNKFRHISPARRCVLAWRLAGKHVRLVLGLPLTAQYRTSQRERAFRTSCHGPLPIPHRKHELRQRLPLPLESSDRLHWPQRSLYLEHSSQHPRCLGACQFRQLSGEFFPSPSEIPYSCSRPAWAVSSRQAELAGGLSHTSAAAAS